jgi:uncharacterized protein YabN with tetrapyrrole methylase and pyrophosphatase domain
MTNQQSATPKPENLLTFNEAKASLEMVFTNAIGNLVFEKALLKSELAKQPGTIEVTEKIVNLLVRLTDDVDDLVRSVNLTSFCNYIRAKLSVEAIPVP